MNNIKRTVLFTVLGALAFTAAGCEFKLGHGKKDEKSITLVSQFEGDEVKRHESYQFTVELKGIKESEVTYSVAGDGATIDATGKMLVKDDAAVGAELKVQAAAGDVKSNEITVKVGQTVATGIRLSPSKSSLLIGETITFTASFQPSYATDKEYEVVVKEGGEFVEIKDGVLQLKDGVEYADAHGNTVTVRGQLKSNPAIYDEKDIYIGQVQAVLSVSSATIIAKQQSEYTIVPDLYNFNGEKIDPTLPFGFVSGNDNIFTVDSNGKVTPKGHGTAKVTVTYGDLVKEATINVILSADLGIEVEGVSNVAKTNGLYFGKADTYHISIANEFDSSKYTQVSEKYTFSFKKLEGNDVVASGDDVATIDANNNITFKTEGRIQCDVKTDSSLNDVVVPEAYEVATTFFFNVNNGVNVKTYPEMYTALENPEVESINFISNIAVTLDNVRYLGDPSTNFYYRVESRGSKYLRGNGYDIDLRDLPLQQGEMFNTTSSAGDDFIRFLPRLDQPHQPYTIQMYDLGLYGNTNYDAFDKNGNSAMSSAPEYSKTFRTGYRIGYNNEKQGFINKDGNPVDQEYYNARVDNFVMNNCVVRGFYFGIWTSHVTGETNNLNVYDSVQKGLLNIQSQITMNNTTFGQVGGFCIEISNDGINDMNNITHDRYATAGTDYHSKPFVNMTGSVSIDNYNGGSDTEYMKEYNNELKATSTALLGAPINSVNELIGMVFDGTAQALAGGNAEKTNVLGQFWRSLLFKPGTEQLNFFDISFMLELGLDGSSETADTYCSFTEEGTAMADLQTLMYLYSVSENTGYSDRTYENYKFIDATIAMPGMYIGKAILTNHQYKAAQ